MQKTLLGNSTVWLDGYLFLIENGVPLMRWEDFLTKVNEHWEKGFFKENKGDAGDKYAISYLLEKIRDSQKELILNEYALANVFSVTFFKELKKSNFPNVKII